MLLTDHSSPHCCIRVVKLKDTEDMAHSNRKRHPETASQSKLVGVSLQDGKLTTEAGFPILEGVSSMFTAQKDSSMPAAVVLSLTSHRKASILDRPLGRLNCKR